ncbi:MAG: hypothetical protein AB1505_32080 [Candidatus Latescibacterota bacterium]
MRRLRRFLDYGKRARDEVGVAELLQWAGRIMADDGQVYSLEEKGLAFEVAACEAIACLLPSLPEEGEKLVLGLAPDRVFLYRQVLSAGSSPARRRGFFELLRARHSRHAAWITSRAAGRLPASDAAEPGRTGGLDAFLQVLEQVDRLPGVVGDEERRLAEEVVRLQAENHQRAEELAAVREDLEVAEDRAERAHRRLRQVEEEAKELTRLLRDSRDNGEKLRTERRSRIRSERESSQAQRELERLRREYVKLERRLQEMAGRLAAAGASPAQPAGPAELRVELGGLRRLDAERVLGVNSEVSEEELGRIRRRFAAVFHPDRVAQLPAWVGVLCDEVLGAVNQACDRVRR